MCAGVSYWSLMLEIQRPPPGLLRGRAARSGQRERRAGKEKSGKARGARREGVKGVVARAHAHHKSELVLATSCRYCAMPSRVRGRSSEAGGEAPGDSTGLRMVHLARLELAEPLLGGLPALRWSPAALCAFECMLRHEPQRADALHAGQAAVRTHAEQLRSTPHAVHEPA